MARYAEKSDRIEKIMSKNTIHPTPGISYWIRTGCMVWSMTAPVVALTTGTIS